MLRLLLPLLKALTIDSARLPLLMIRSGLDSGVELEAGAGTDTCINISGSGDDEWHGGRERRSSDRYGKGEDRCDKGKREGCRRRVDSLLQIYAMMTVRLIWFHMFRIRQA